MVNSAIITVMTQAARKASKGLLRDFGEVDKLQISKKGVANFVTSADLRTEQVLMEELKRARSKFGILSEEAGWSEGADPSWRFVIDPIDGTTNFIHAIPYFCIAVSLEKRDAQGVWDTTAAVIYDPIHDEMFHAEKNGGAFLNGYRMQSSARTEDVILATAAPRKWKEGYGETLRAMERITDQGASVRCLGSAALDLAYVAAGRIDGVWYHQLQWWDMSAGALLVREAGGIATNHMGDIPSESTPSILAANRGLHPQLLTLLKP